MEPVHCAQSQSLLLSKFPREIRDTLWAFALQADGDISVFDSRKISEHNGSGERGDRDNSRGSSVTPLLPPLLYSCQQIRTEGTAIFYKVNTFRCIVDEHTILQPCGWLGSLADYILDTIRKVVIQLTVSQRQIGQLYESGTTYNSAGCGGAGKDMPMFGKRWTSMEQSTQIYGAAQFYDLGAWVNAAARFGNLRLNVEKLRFEVCENDEFVRTWLTEWEIVMEEMKWFESKACLKL